MTIIVLTINMAFVHSVTWHSKLTTCHLSICGIVNHIIFMDFWTMTDVIRDLRPSIIFSTTLSNHDNTNNIHAHKNLILQLTWGSLSSMPAV